MHKRAETAYVYEYVYMLGDRSISKDEAQRGLANGDYEIKDGQIAVVMPPALIKQEAVPELKPEPAPVPAPVPALVPAPVAEPEPVPEPVKKAPKVEAVKPTQQVSSSASGEGLDSEFPDGVLDCSEFPSAYGAVRQDYNRLGGWIGIQIPGIVTSAGLDDIMTVVPDQCSGPDCCSEGAYCSYDCPSTHLKSQWPLTQGATGQSVGGILCKNGKLHLTNPGMSKKLCIAGTDQVKIYLENKTDEIVCACKTDYPGTESQTIPMCVEPGEKIQVACPDQRNYYNWKGSPTSSQVYLNLKGASKEKACTWSKPGSNLGNYSPACIGFSFTGTEVFSSIFQNAPTNINGALNYNVEIGGVVFPAGLPVAKFKIPNGTGGENGLTTGAKSGSITYTFT